MRPPKMSRSQRERWVFDFANAQLDELAEHERQRTIHEVWEFGHRTRSQPLLEGGMISRLSSGGIEACTWRDVLTCHQDAKAAIEGLLKDDATPKWRVSLTLQVLSYGELVQKLVQETDHVVDAFRIELSIILARLSPKIASCPAPAPIPDELRHLSRTRVSSDVCGKLFLRQRKDKVYCSYNCRMRVAMRQRRHE